MLATALVASCGLVAVRSPTPTLKAPYTAAPPTSAFSPERTASVSPRHGRPYSAERLLQLLTASQRVPELLKTDAWASALAERIWSYDGEPYQELVFAANCEDREDACDLDVVGVPGFAEDRDNADSYLFTLHPRTSLIEDQAPQSLAGLPRDLTPMLDAAARALVGEEIGAHTLIGVRWLRPPPDDAYLLHYATDDQEGEDQIYITYDRGANTVLSVERR